MPEIFRVINNNLHRPMKLVYLKLMCTHHHRKYLKDDSHRERLERYMKRKEDYLDSYFLKHHSHLLDISDVDEVISDRHLIFIYWHQGMKNAPDIVRKAIDSIIRHAGCAEVILLDGENYRKYVDISPDIREKLERGKISIQNFSDYLRVKLLERYDCLWIDATIYAFKDIPECYFDWDYFSVRSDRLYEGKKEYSLYPDLPFGQVYLLGGKKKRIFRQIRMFFEEYFERRSVYLDYFMIYYFFNFLYRHDEKDHELIDGLARNNTHIEDHFYYRDRPFDPSFIGDDDVFAKLSYKIDSSSAQADEDSHLSTILRM